MKKKETKTKITNSENTITQNTSQLPASNNSSNYSISYKISDLFKPCHSTKLVFTYNNTNFYATKYSLVHSIIDTLETELQDTLFVDLTGYQLNKYFICYFSEKLKDFRIIFNNYHVPNFISIDWPDFSIINFTKKDWLELIDYMLNFKNVYIYCNGGHGRTGTAFAIIYSLLTNCQTPIKTIKELICEKCIESLEQIQYIQQITGTNEDYSQLPFKYKLFSNSWINKDIIKPHDDIKSIDYYDDYDIDYDDKWINDYQNYGLYDYLQDPDYYIKKDYKKDSKTKK